MSSPASPLVLLSGWMVAAVLALAVLVGALVRPGYLQVLSLLVIEGLLVVWVLWLASCCREGRAAAQAYSAGVGGHNQLTSGGPQGAPRVLMETTSWIYPCLSQKFCLRRSR